MPHESYVAAQTSASKLRIALERRAGPFGDGARPTDVVDPDRTYFGEHRGATYIFDGEMVLGMNSSPDVFVNVSKELSTVVVACGYETVSGTYMFVAAENGELLRDFSASTASRKPWSMGSPLATEALTPLGTIEGIHAALASLGFDVRGWRESASKVSVNYPVDHAKWGSEDGPLGLRQAHEAHEKEHGIPFEQWLREFKPQIVLTHSADPKAGFGLADGSVGFSLEMKKPASWHERFWRWISK